MVETIFLAVFLVLQLAVLSVTALLFLYFASAIFVWPPSIPTDRKVRRAIIGMIGGKCSSDSNIKIIDLGSGYGHLIRAISKRFGGAEIVGVELLRFPYRFSKFIFRKNKNIRIIKGDLYEQDVSGYDVVVFFLRKNHRVDQLLLQKIKKGAIIISNNFPLRTIEPTSVVEIRDIFAKRRVYFYQR